MCGSSQQDLQHAFISYLLRATKQERKSSPKFQAVLYLSLRRPKQCFLQVSGNTLQQVEWFKCTGVVFTSDESQNKGIETLLVKQTQFFA